MVGPPNSHVDILLSTYNGAAWLPELLDSIRSQTIDTWTLRIRDDGSTDETLELISAAVADDGRVIRLADDLGNLGPAASFMQLLGAVEGSHFAFCDQDDVWHPTKLERSLAAIGANEIAAIYTDATVTNAEGATTHQSALAERGVPANGQVPYGHLLINNAAIGATLLGTSALAQRSVELARGRPVLMHDWWVALTAGHQGELRVLTESTIQWRRHSDTVTGERPVGLRRRAQRRRDYLSWSAEAASWLADASPGSNPEADLAVHALAPMHTATPTIRGLRRATREGGVRAWTNRAQLALAFSVGIGRRRG